MTAGSKPSFLARRGRVQPTILAMMTVTPRARQMTRSTERLMLALPIRSRSTSSTFRKHTAARVMPQSTAVRISFHSTVRASENSSSSRLRARITVTEDWEPQLPPVSISMGMKAVRAASLVRALSKEEMIIPVKVADTISSISQGIRCLYNSKGELFR